MIKNSFLRRIHDTKIVNRQIWRGVYRQYCMFHVWKCTTKHYTICSVQQKLPDLLKRRHALKEYVYIAFLEHFNHWIIYCIQTHISKYSSAVEMIKFICLLVLLLTGYCLVAVCHISSLPFSPGFCRFYWNMLIQLNNSIRLCLRVEFLHPGHDEAFRSCNIIELQSVEKPVIHYSRK